MLTEEVVLKFLNDMDYRFNIFYIRDLLKKYVQKGGEQRKQLLKIVRDLGIQGNVDFNDNKVALDIINSKFPIETKISSLNKKVLEELFAKTDNEFFNLLMKYRSVSDKYSKTVSFMKSASNTDFDKENKGLIKDFMNDNLREKDRKNFRKRVKFNHTIKSGAVIVSNPSIPFGIEDIKEIFGFNFVYRGDNLKDCLDLFELLLEKYQPLMMDDEGGYFIILRNTLFVKVLDHEFDIMPFMFSEVQEEEVRTLIQKFRKEFIEVNQEKTQSTLIDDIIGNLQVIADSASNITAEYKGEFGHIKIDYDNISVVINDINLLELIQRSGDTENIKKNINNIFESIIPKNGKLDRFRIDIDRKGSINASTDVVIGEKSYILNLENGEFNIRGDILF